VTTTSRAGDGPEPRQRIGGRLDRTLDSIILEATLDALTECGYDATSMNDVAARAGVGKATIYRRWSSKAALVAEALAVTQPSTTGTEMPDTGTLEGDFDEVVRQCERDDDGPFSSDLILRIALAANRDRELGAVLDELMPSRGSRKVNAILRQAVARGELAGNWDWSLIAEVGTAMGLLRIIGGRRVDADYVRAVIDTLVLPAVHAHRLRNT
jgi:AcrR family transcriptional regulator